MDGNEIRLRQQERTAKAHALHTLTLYPEWDLYRQEMEQMELRFQERLLSCPLAEMDNLRGFIMGLRAAYHYPDTLQSPPK